MKRRKKPSGSNDYNDFLFSKSHSDNRYGFEPKFLPSFLFDFQSALTNWACVKGRSAIFADCGLGKTLMELVWAQNVLKRTNRPVLIATPLAVSMQMAREAEKFGIEAKRSTDGKIFPITITNYERLHHFDPEKFAGMACDESSILKSFDGARRNEITAFLRKIEYRLLATATAAPNDYIELGTSSEALGYLGYMDMLNRFFKNDLHNSAQGRMRGEIIKWRFKGHAEMPFWRWVCSWARAVRKPSDLGFDDGPFKLPPIEEEEHLVKATNTGGRTLFEVAATTLPEQREEQRRTIVERCERAAELASTRKPALMWCHLNDEGDLLEKLVPGAVQVSGKDSDEAKEEKLLAFADGSVRTLVTKPKIGAWGLNFQHCSHIVGFPSHSFEQYYQGIRRCWRFGQKNKVHVDLVATRGGMQILDNLRRKAQQADKMFDALVAEMNQAVRIDRMRKFEGVQEIPQWLSTIR